jgi:hypothetical protein
MVDVPQHLVDTFYVVIPQLERGVAEVGMMIFSSQFSGAEEVGKIFGYTVSRRVREATTSVLIEEGGSRGVNFPGMDCEVVFRKC